MQHSNIQPDPRIAMARYWRRCQLWANARRRMGDEAFFANLATVARSVEAQLEADFGA